MYVFDFFDYHNISLTSVVLISQTMYLFFLMFTLVHTLFLLFLVVPTNEMTDFSDTVWTILTVCYSSRAFWQFNLLFSELYTRDIWKIPRTLNPKCHIFLPALFLLRSPVILNFFFSFTSMSNWWSNSMDFLSFYASYYLLIETISLLS